MKSPSTSTPPATDIYHKSEVLYGMHIAKDGIIKTDTAILLEGYTDVISLHVNGITNAVASCGTALTSEQSKLIKRYASQVIIIRDGDEAGVKATARDIEILLAEGILPAVVALPEGQDPDTFIQQKGDHGFLEYIDAQKADWLDWKLAELRKLYDITQPAGKAKATDELLLLLRRISHPILREEYAEKMGTVLGISPETLATYMGEGS
jgi:DNA primase